MGNCRSKPLNNEWVIKTPIDETIIITPKHSKANNDQSKAYNAVDAKQSVGDIIDVLTTEGVIEQPKKLSTTDDDSSTTYSYSYSSSTNDDPLYNVNPDATEYSCIIDGEIEGIVLNQPYPGKHYKKYNETPERIQYRSKKYDLHKYYYKTLSFPSAYAHHMKWLKETVDIERKEELDEAIESNKILQMENEDLSKRIRSLEKQLRNCKRKSKNSKSLNNKSPAKQAVDASTVLYLVERNEDQTN